MSHAMRMIPRGRNYDSSTVSWHKVAARRPLDGAAHGRRRPSMEDWESQRMPVPLSVVLTELMASIDRSVAVGHAKAEIAAPLDFVFCGELVGV